MPAREHGLPSRLRQPDQRTTPLEGHLKFQHFVLEGCRDGHRSRSARVQGLAHHPVEAGTIAKADPGRSGLAAECDWQRVAAGHLEQVDPEARRHGVHAPRREHPSAEGDTHFLAPRKRGWPLSASLSASTLTYIHSRDRLSKSPAYILKY